MRINFASLVTRFEEVDEGRGVVGGVKRVDTFICPVPFGTHSGFLGETVCTYIYHGISYWFAV